MTSTDRTPIRIGLPLPMDLVMSLTNAIGTMYPDATMGGDGPGYGSELVLNVSHDDRRPKATKKALRDAKVTSADPEDELEMAGFKNGTLTVNTPREAAERLATWAHTLLAGQDAANYVEQVATDGEGRRLVLIAAWSEEQTPHELRLAAERRAEEAETRLAALTGEGGHR